MPHGLHRTAAAQWVSASARLTPPLRPSHLRYWETIGLLRAQAPGIRRPACYGVDDLVRLRLVAELRREGVPVQRIRKAVESLASLFGQEILRSPGRWHLAVTATGEIVHVTSGTDLIELTRGPGQTGWLFLLNAVDYIEDAETALRRAAG